MNKVIKIVSWFIVLVSIGYCIVSLTHNYDGLPKINWNVAMFIRTLGLLPISLLTGILICEGWRILLSSQKITISFGQSVAILGISQIGKYLPGNIFHYVGRVAIGLSQGIPSVTIAISVWIETVLLLVAAGFLIIVGVIVDRDVKTWLSSILTASSFSVFWMGGCSLLILFACWLLVRNKRAWIENHLNFLKALPLFQLISLYILIFFVYGCIVKFIPHALWGHGVSVSITQTIWRFALCWIAGFIVPGAPAGLGVREALFTRLFAPELGEGVAACIALFFRVVTTLGDLVTFAIAYWIGRRVLPREEAI